MPEHLEHIDLFSGIGGFALAARWAGIKTVQFVEIDPFCQMVLRKNFPNVPIWDDIKTFRWGGAHIKGQRNDSTFLLTAGVPCQPASCAGKRRGTGDDRWLWDEAIRVLAEVKPTWAIFENVAGLLSLELGVVFDNLLFQMEVEGYEVQAFIIPACAVNAPHRRDRVWICARRADSHAPDTEGEGLEGRNTKRTGCTNGWAAEQPISGNGGYETRQDWDEPWFAVASRLCALDDGLPLGLVGYLGITEEHLGHRDKHRVQKLKAVGNAIVPQVAYQIMRAILTAEGIRP